MIVYEKKEINGTTYDYAYSDNNCMIERDGALYSEAVDPIGSNRVYIETNKPIEGIDQDISDEKVLTIVSENEG